jgi:hypothetical protein
LAEKAKLLQAEQRKQIEMELRPKLIHERRTKVRAAPPDIKDDDWS